MSFLDNPEYGATLREYHHQIKSDFPHIPFGVSERAFFNLYAQQRIVLYLRHPETMGGGTDPAEWEDYPYDLLEMIAIKEGIADANRSIYW
jgi:hypothetical protein